jgi:glyoxylase-like metal-dependent hydrolase (beta-lactamase superfamily II)
MEIKPLAVGPLLTNCYLVVSEKELLIIDPGGDGKEILREAEKIKAKVKYIINTHGHPDHIFANEEIRKETGAKILIHEAEEDFISFKPDSLLKDGDEIKIGKSVLKVLHTPGHTRGGICLLAGDSIFTGDTLFKDGYGRTDLPGGSEEQLEKSLEKLEKILKPEMTVYPGHGEIFKISQ